MATLGPCVPGLRPAAILELGYALAMVVGRPKHRPRRCKSRRIKTFERRTRDSEKRMVKLTPGIENWRKMSLQELLGGEQ